MPQISDASFLFLSFHIPKYEVGIKCTFPREQLGLLLQTPEQNCKELAIPFALSWLCVGITVSYNELIILMLLYNS